MEKDFSIVHELKDINSLIFRKISSRYKELGMDVTPVHAKIIMAIYKSDVPVCQKDLERPVSCNKSSLSNVINTMEKNGLLVRKASFDDSRINYLELTDTALEIAEFLRKDREIIEKELCNGINEEEKNNFYSIISKVRENLERI